MTSPFGPAGAAQDLWQVQAEKGSLHLPSRGRTGSERAVHRDDEKTEPRGDVGEGGQGAVSLEQEGARLSLEGSRCRPSLTS